RVPSTRTLAEELGVSRIPVLNAYAQLLAEGYFEARVGAGTVVSSTLPEQSVLPARSVPRPGLRRVPRPKSMEHADLPSAETVVRWLAGRRGAFSPGQPALDHFPFKILSRLTARRSPDLPLASMHYGEPMGCRCLREVIASYLRTSRGVRCEADHIMIVSGSQQALEVSTRVFLERGSRVWMEEPGYRFARDVF